MKTEEQAKQCWCPERAKEAALDGGLLKADRLCITTECMMWLWGSRERETKNDQTLKSGEKPDGYVDRDTPDADGFTWSSIADGERCCWYQYRYTKQGYCGLAGIP